MPTVPTLDRSVGIATVQGGEQTATATAESFGAGDLRSLSRIGSGVSQTAVQAAGLLAEVERQNRDTRITDITQQAESEMLVEMNKIYSKTGFEATTALDDSIKVSEDLKKKYTQQMKDPKDIAAFNKRIANVVSGHQQRAMGFGLQSMRKFRQDTAESNIKNATELAVHARNDKREISRSEQRVRDSVIEFATGKRVEVNEETGERTLPTLTKEEKSLVKRKEDEAVHRMYSEVLDNVSTDSAQAGMDFLTQNKEKFLPSQYDELVKTMKGRVDKEFVIKNTDTLAVSGTTKEEVLKNAESFSKGKDPQVITQFRKQVGDRFDELEDIKQMAVKRNFEKEFDKLTANPVQYEIPDETSAQDYNRLYNMKQKLLKDERSKRGVGPADETDFKTFNQLRKMPFNQFAQVDIIEQFGNKLSAGDIKTLMNEQRSGRPKYYQEASTMAKRSIESILDTSDDRGFITSEDPVFGKAANDFSRTREQNFYNEFYRRINDIPQAEVTQEKIQETLDDMLKPIDINPGIFSSEKIVFKYEAILEDQGEAVQLDALENAPTKLQKFGDDLKYDTRFNAYYVESGNVRDLYDNNGNFLRRQKKNRKVKDAIR